MSLEQPQLFQLVYMNFSLFNCINLQTNLTNLLTDVSVTQLWLRLQA